MSSLSPRSWVSVSAAGTEAKLTRGAAEGMAEDLAKHLNRVLNLTVSDSHLSVSPVRDGEKFQLTRLVGRQNVPLRLRGTKASLFVRLLVVEVISGHTLSLDMAL
jgi:hypothetical protein